MYLALYRKYRPRTFEDVLGQPHITQTLQNEVMSGRTAHAYLFTGPRGTGKTTCSKILAQAVNCLHPVGGDPCFACENCRAIEQGSTMDIMEIDAASNNGVDNIRDLRDEANFMPSQCKYRVYIIDETHMLSPGAFNALLKIMEEPPEHVKFILATTEAHKVPATILSRCQRFDFKRIRSSDIRDRLLSIAEREGFALDPAAAELIARLADGGMRDALSLLDHCAGFSSEITFDSAVHTIGLVDRGYLFDLTDCILRQDASRAIREIDRLYSMSKDMQALLEELLNHFRDLMLLLALENPDDLVTALPEERERLREYAGQFSMPAVLRAMGVLQEAIDKMGRNFDRRMTLELCLVKLCTPAMDASPDALAARLARLEGLFSAAPAMPRPAPREAAPPEPPVPLASVNPVPMEAASAPVEAASVPVEAVFAPVEAASVPAEAASVPMEAASVPVEAASVPVEAASVPVEAASVPVEAASAPAEAASVPAEAASVPAEAASVPVEAASVPVEAAFAPVEAASAPAPLPEWADILRELLSSCGPLYGVLQDSHAFTDGGFLYIDSANEITGRMMKQEGNAARLMAAVEQKTGRRYKIRVKSAASASIGVPDALSALLSKARESGVAVREE